MRQRTTLPLTLLILVVVAALLGGAPFAHGSPVGQQDATDLQGTVNALVEQRFNQTLEAQAPALTATAEALNLLSGTATFEAQETAAAAFQLTVDAAFNQALTATAEAMVSPTPLPVEVETRTLPEGIRITLVPVGDVEERFLAEAQAIIERRLQGLGIPADVDRDDDDAIFVEMATPENQDEILRVIQQSGLVEFVDFSGLIDHVDDLLNEQIQTTGGEQRDDDDALRHPLNDERFQTIVTGDEIESAEVAPGADGSWQIIFRFSDEGGERMSTFTREHVGEPLAIVLDGEVISVAIISGEFGRDGGVINGGFTEEEAERLALQLNFGALPVELEIDDVDRMEVAPQVALEATPTATESPFTPTPSLTPTFDPRPTVTRGQIFVAEEVFERGRMFYVQPVGEIWVMVVSGEGRGEWMRYEDTFVEGEPETDPSLVPPEGMLQPVRGFGKLWRETPEVRDALGWAITPEFGYQSEYRYHPGGQVVDGQYVPGPGYHVLFSLAGEAFQFNEDDNTWELHSGD